MESNDICEKIVELDGDCFRAKDRPSCQTCPFQQQCLHRMIAFAEVIPKEARLRWALDKLVEEHLLNE